jgi:hypothetical protein
MLKSIFLGTAVLISAPALAQDATQATPTQQSAPQSQPATPPADTATDATTAEQAASEGAATGQSATAQAPTTATEGQAAPAASENATTPASGAAATSDQITQVVDAEFPTYDKNSDSKLDKAEFGSWMVALKTASDPKTNAADPATAKWVGGAFTTADKDKSAAISKQELTAFLSQGSSN